MDHKQYEEATQAFTQAIQLSESVGLLSAAEITYNYLGQLVTSQRGDLKAAREHFLRAVELAKQIGSLTKELFDLSMVLQWTLLLGEMKTAKEMCGAVERLLQMTESAGPPGHVAALALAYFRFIQGDWEDAVSRNKEVRIKARAQGDLNYLINASTSLAEVLIEMGALEEAEGVLVETVEIGDRAFGGYVDTHCDLICVLARKGRFEEARCLLSKAEAKAGAQPGFIDEVYLGIAKTNLAVAERRWAEAWAEFDSYIRLCDRAGTRWHRAQTLRQWAEAYLTRSEPGDRQQAQKLLQQALELYEAMDLPKYSALVQARLQVIVERN